MHKLPHRMTSNRHSTQLHFIILHHVAGYTAPSTENTKTLMAGVPSLTWIPNYRWRSPVNRTADLTPSTFDRRHCEQVALAWQWRWLGPASTAACRHWRTTQLQSVSHNCSRSTQRQSAHGRKLQTWSTR